MSSEEQVETSITAKAEEPNSLTLMLIYQSTILIVMYYNLII